MDVDASLVARLVARQFPRWAHLAVLPVDPGGWDNRTFRLGDDMSVRLPSADCYADQTAKEHRWLPALAPSLPLPIPDPLAMGVPADGYPWHWSVYRWLDGEGAAVARIDDLPRLAAALGEFLYALWRVDPADGPPPGRHNFLRGAPPAVYDAETRDAIASLRGRIDAGAATAVWDAALAATWRGPPVWLHGDVAPANLLVREGRLAAVIDFGCAAVGDPACDLAIAWTFLAGESRDAFFAALPVDAGARARGRGWALWKALLTLAADDAHAAQARRTLEELLADHRDGS